MYKIVHFYITFFVHSYITINMKLAGVGRNNALYIKSTIKKRLENENYYVPNNAVPMQEVVKYLNIDIPYLEGRVKTLTKEA